MGPDHGCSTRARCCRGLHRASPKPMWWRRLGAVGWTIAAIVSQGCVATTARQDRVPRDGTAEVAIAISNETSRPMRFYIHAGAASLPLGTVPALASRTFRVPVGFGTAASAFEVEARERGAGAGLLTEPFVVGSGRRVVIALHRSASTTVTVHP